jgi:signal transduction histidine kinase
MTNLTPLLRAARPPPAQWALDIRNLLATIGLHLDRWRACPALTAPRRRARLLIARAGGMCSEAVAAAGAADGRRRRHPFDITATIRQVVDLVAPLGPEGLHQYREHRGPCRARRSRELFRVLFNLLHNALAVARSSAKLRRIDISVERAGDHRGEDRR